MTNESEHLEPTLDLDVHDIEQYKAKYGFTDEQIHQFYDTFLIFDLDGDGEITTDELGTVMASLDQRPSLQELEALIQGVDVDDSGTVDFDEFLQMMAKKIQVNPEEELHEVFTVFDTNDDGFISADELFDVLSRLGEPITRAEVTEMIKEADINGDGVVDFLEFRGILKAK